MATCKKVLSRAIKVSRVDGTVTPVGDPFDFAGATVDESLFGACPEVTPLNDSVCITTTGSDCVEGVKRICQVVYDCATEEATVEVLGFIMPDSSFLKIEDAVTPFAVIPCPIVEIISETRCELPA